jgi:hypothetical protein
VRQPVDDDKYIYVTLDFDGVEEAATFKGFLETTVWASAEPRQRSTARPLRGSSRT